MKRQEPTLEMSSDIRGSRSYIPNVLLKFDSKRETLHDTINLLKSVFCAMHCYVRERKRVGL